VNARNPRAAEAERQQARELLAVLVKEAPDNADYKLRYALALDDYGIFLNQTADRRLDAVEAIREARDLLRALAADDPKNLDLIHKLALRQMNLGQLLATTRKDAKDAAAADAEYTEAAALLEGLAAKEPRDDTHWKELPSVYVNRAGLMAAVGRDRDTEKSWQQAAAAYEKRIALHPADPNLVVGLAYAVFSRAKLGTARSA